MEIYPSIVVNIKNIKTRTIAQFMVVQRENSRRMKFVFYIKK